MLTKSDNFSGRLSLAITAANMKARRVALVAGLSPAYVSELISGKRDNPSPDVVKKLAAATRCSKNWLLTGVGKMEAGEHESALAASILAGGQRIADNILAEDSPVYGTTTEAERVHREIMQRLDEACLSPDELAKAMLHRRLDELFEVLRNPHHGGKQ